MVHILLLILKIIGIIVLSILGLALLILFFPITYVGKANGNIEEKKVTGNIRADGFFICYIADYGLRTQRYIIISDY